jgi:hypothetical protein
VRDPTRLHIAVVRRRIRPHCHRPPGQVRPSRRLYDELIAIWRDGDFRFNFGGAGDCEPDLHKHSLSEQDVLVEYFRRHRDRYHTLDKCYNYRGSSALRAFCGECHEGTCDARIKVLHIGKLLKWVDMSAWQVHSWRGVRPPRPHACSLLATPRPPA